MKRTHQLKILLSAPELKTLKKLATDEGLTVSVFLRTRIRTIARVRHVELKPRKKPAKPAKQPAKKAAKK